jgi:hypothetical protein
LDVNQIIADAVPIVVSVLQEPFSGSQPQVLEKFPDDAHNAPKICLFSFGRNSK